MGKQMEGDNRQRRERAKDARDQGEAPSAEGVTTGASVQRRHLSHDADHGERMAGPGWGKQQPDRVAPDPRPGSVADRDAGTSPAAPPTESPPRDVGKQRSQPGQLDEDEQRVFEAVVRRELRHGTALASEVAQDAGLPRPETEVVLRRLVDHHDVVQQLPGETDGEDFGPRYRAKARV